MPFTSSKIVLEFATKVEYHFVLIVYDVFRIAHADADIGNAGKTEISQHLFLVPHCEPVFYGNILLHFSKIKKGNLLTDNNIK